MSATLQKVKRAERKAREATAEKNKALVVRDEAVTEHRRLLDQLNSPHTDQFLESVRWESVHQRERWGAEHDEGKAPTDWLWLVGWLTGKAVHAAIEGDTDKALHHTISSAAALLNWHAHLKGESTRMRPGTGTEARQA